MRNAIRDIVKVIQTEEYQYQDPVTSFLKGLYIEFDFEAAQKALKEAVDAVVGNDFFLGEFKEEFLDNARYLISEAYCRIHQKIDIGRVLVLYFHGLEQRVLTFLAVGICRKDSISHQTKVKSGL